VSPEENNTGYANSVGELFRTKRESKKLSLNEVHQDTRMSINVLKALENDDFGSFESEIYLKGFVKNYAAYLGIDPEFSIRVLDGQRGDKKASSHGTTWDIEETVKEEKIKSPRILGRFVVPALVVIILILSVLLMLERRKVKELQSNLHRVGQAVHSVEAESV
jgi:cytoskeletal protein RodZ